MLNPRERRSRFTMNKHLNPDYRITKKAFFVFEARYVANLMPIPGFSKKNKIRSPSRVHDYVLNGKALSKPSVRFN